MTKHVSYDNLNANETCFIQALMRYVLSRRYNMVTSVKYTELPQLSLQGKLIKSKRLQSKAVKKNKRENSKQEKEKRL